jgi:hypothetical protein
MEGWLTAKHAIVQAASDAVDQAASGKANDMSVRPRDPFLTTAFFSGGHYDGGIGIQRGSIQGTALKGAAKATSARFASLLGGWLRANHAVGQAASGKAKDMSVQFRYQFLHHSALFRVPF